MSTAIEQRLARTYNTPSYEDPADAVADYRRVQRVAANHPNKGSSALSNIVGLPRGRIRGWIDDDADSMPDAVRAISVAQNKGWLDPTGDTAVALATIVGHLLGGGSITAETYVPAVAEGRRASLADIEAAFRAVNVRTKRRHADSKSRSTEIIPADNASILGRTLVAWGVPLGETKPTELPELLEHVDATGREEFVKAYILHRGTNLPEKATSQCAAEYPLSFQTAFAELVREVTGEEATAGEGAVTISATAMRKLGLAEV